MANEISDIKSNRWNKSGTDLGGGVVSFLLAKFVFNKTATLE